MSNIAAYLMVASGALRLTGAAAAKGRLGAAASSLMLLLARTSALSPVAWSGTLFVIGMILAASLRPAPVSVQQQAAPVPVGVTTMSAGLTSGTGMVEGASPEVSAAQSSDEADRPTSDAPGSQRPRLRVFPRVGRTAAVCSAITHPNMARQHSTTALTVAAIMPLPQAAVDITSTPSIRR